MAHYSQSVPSAADWIRNSTDDFLSAHSSRQPDKHFHWPDAVNPHQMEHCAKSNPVFFRKPAQGEQIGSGGPAELEIPDPPLPKWFYFPDSIDFS